MSKKLTRTLEMIATERWPCQCQFGAHDLFALRERGLIEIVPSKTSGHGRINVTDAGRSALGE